MASTLTESNAVISLTALSAGGADYVAKPTSGSQIHGADDFKRELITKVLTLGGATDPATAAVKIRPKRDRSAAVSKPTTIQPISLRKPSAVQPRAIAIGSSIGRSITGKISAQLAGTRFRGNAFRLSSNRIEYGCDLPTERRTG